MSRYSVPRIMKRSYAIEEAHVMWKGEGAGYGAKHDHARKYYKGSSCEHCGTGEKLQLANVSGEYKREKTDWKTLCASCHHKFDNLAARLRANAKIGISGYRGVKPAKGGWCSRITIDCKEIYLGYFKDKENAYMMRLAAEAQLIR